MNKQTDTIDLNRRDFLRGSALSSLAVALGATALQGQDKPAEATAPTAYKTAANPVNVAVLGLGQRGRDVLKTLSLLVNANVVAICDHYEPMVRRSKDLAPKAVAYSDYKELLADKNVKAIVLCTPTHQHKDLAIEIMKAGKHIYCEAPLASTVEDSKAIAAAAKDYQKVHFSSGLQLRSDPQRYFLLSFIRSGAMGKNVKAHAQWHKKQSWRQSSPNPDREREMNWKLDSKVSTGLAGEIAVHQIDTGRWFIEGAPLSITAFGSLINWNDGRKVQDSLVLNLEYPDGVLHTVETTMANSYDGDYEVYYGTDSAIMIRENKAWMFKEVDAPMLGWEVYARKDQFYKETGIALIANATKQTALGDKPVEEAPFANTPLFYALENFLICADMHAGAVEDYSSSFDINDKAAFGEYLLTINKHKPNHATWKDGLASSVLAIKANEAAVTGQRIKIEPEWLKI